MRLLGDEHYEGRHVEQNFKRAHQLYETAAAGGNATAMTSLAAMYMTGKGVEEDMATAAQLLQRAAASGEPNAIELLKINPALRGEAKDPMATDEVDKTDTPGRDP